MAIAGGFGVEYDIISGRVRPWYLGKDGVRRFTHDDTPCDLPGFTPAGGFDSDPPLPDPQPDGQEG